MIKPRDPRELVVDLLPRSICSVQVAAVLADRYGIFSWGWNSVGKGEGEHAEAAVIRRANKRRLNGSTLYVASQRRRNEKTIMSAPCVACHELITNWDMKITYRDQNGDWWRMR